MRIRYRAACQTWRSASCIAGDGCPNRSPIVSHCRIQRGSGGGNKVDTAKDAQHWFLPMAGDACRRGSRPSRRLDGGPVRRPVRAAAAACDGVPKYDGQTALDAASQSRIISRSLTGSVFTTFGRSGFPCRYIRLGNAGGPRIDREWLWWLPTVRTDRPATPDGPRSRSEQDHDPGSRQGGSRRPKDSSKGIRYELRDGRGQVVAALGVALVKAALKENSRAAANWLSRHSGPEWRVPTAGRPASLAKSKTTIVIRDGLRGCEPQPQPDRQVLVAETVCPGLIGCRQSRSG
jgi:hypothetical protein